MFWIVLLALVAFSITVLFGVRALAVVILAGVGLVLMFLFSDPVDTRSPECKATGNWSCTKK